jgi:hypothetical protein
MQRPIRAIPACMLLYDLCTQLPINTSVRLALHMRLMNIIETNSDANALRLSMQVSNCHIRSIFRGSYNLYPCTARCVLRAIGRLRPGPTHQAPYPVQLTRPWSLTE